jgi:hypothetical protein
MTINFQSDYSYVVFPAEMAAKSRPPFRSRLHEDNDNNGSLLSRTIFAPILFLSFLFSLLIIDRQTSSSVLSPVGVAPANAKEAGSGDATTPAYSHSHQRKLVKQDIAQAFAMHTKVAAAMCVFGGLVFVGTAWLGLQAWLFLNT